MAKPTIDDKTAEKWARMFFKDLDPQKYYFLQGDIDEFMPMAPTLDDKIREETSTSRRKSSPGFSSGPTSGSRWSPRSPRTSPTSPSTSR